MFYAPMNIYIDFQSRRVTRRIDRLLLNVTTTSLWKAWAALGASIYIAEINNVSAVGDWVSGNFTATIKVGTLTFLQLLAFKTVDYLLYLKKIYIISFSFCTERSIYLIRYSLALLCITEKAFDLIFYLI